MYYITVYWMIPEIMMAALGCHDDAFFCNSLSGDYFWIYDFNSSGFNVINTVSYIVSAVVLGAIGLVNIALAINNRRRRTLNTLIWMGFAAAVVGSYLADYYGSFEELYPYAIGTGLSLSAILPLLYLVVVWSAPKLFQLWKQRKENGRKAKIS